MKPVDEKPPIAQSDTNLVSTTHLEKTLSQLQNYPAKKEKKMEWEVLKAKANNSILAMAFYYLPNWPRQYGSVI